MDSISWNKLKHQNTKTKPIEFSLLVISKTDNKEEYKITITFPYGGIRKFLHSLPLPNKPNDIGNYIPVAVPDITSYPGQHYYEIAAVEYSQKIHSDLPKATSLRGFVQVTGHDVNGNPLRLYCKPVT